ncbi:hypothetical protein [Lyngbya aestuarii]|uniref:hypothetical protein n=1 Tax=Lyngbya aestuarii TaxID=118322 RepID=UPI00403D5803
MAKRSFLGKVVFDKPYLLLVEAKQDKSDQALGKCLADLITAQRLNEDPQMTVFGIVYNSNRWQFGKLSVKNYTRNIILYSIQELDKLFAAVNYIFLQCKLQLEEKLAT